jgi:hypothetical protein
MGGRRRAMIFALAALRQAQCDEALNRGSDTIAPLSGVFF